MRNHYALSNPVASLQAPAPEQISQGSALHGTGVPSNTLTACRLACTQLYHFMLTYVCSCQYFSESIFIILSYFPTVSRELLFFVGVIRSPLTKWDDPQKRVLSPLLSCAAPTYHKAHLVGGGWAIHLKIISLRVQGLKKSKKRI